MPVELPSFPDASVDVWCVWLDSSETANRTFRSVLSSDEIFRADRFVNAHLTELYQTAHGALRVLLSHYMKCDPHEVAFTFGTSGKPVLAGNSHIHFNMSHSGGLAAYAFSSVCQLGIDIERIRDVPSLESIAENYFCRAESAELLSIMLGTPRHEAFFRCWTRKESYVKAIGDGLSVPLDQFQVTLKSNVPARFCHIGNSLEPASEWTLQHLEPAPGYLGAVAYKGASHSLRVNQTLHAQDIIEMLQAS